jgi:CheY-like chemotaxis protein
MATILVVDDEEPICSLVSHVLSSAGHQVLAASNGLEGVALFRSFFSSIDLIITDLNISVMDGYEFVRLIQSDRPDAKIICMTGNPDRDYPQGTTLLRKPFRVDQLREMVNQICAQTRHHGD